MNSVITNQACVLKAMVWKRVDKQPSPMDKMQRRGLIVKLLQPAAAVFSSFAIIQVYFMLPEIGIVSHAPISRIKTSAMMS